MNVKFRSGFSEHKNNDNDDLKIRKHTVTGEDIGRMDPSQFISHQSRKKKKAVELDRITENLIAFSNSLQNNFLDDAQNFIRDEARSFSRNSFDEAILFLYMTVFYQEELPFETILDIMKNKFSNFSEMEIFDGSGGNFRHLINANTPQRKELDRLCLLTASKISWSFVINLIVEKADLSNVCITEIILKSIVENNMFDAINKILDGKLNISKGIARIRKRYRNTYNPEEVEEEYLQEKEESFYFSDNRNLALLGANYIKGDISNDAPTQLSIREIDVISEMITQNK